MHKYLERERKLIQIFITFVDKIFVPQIKRIEGSLTEWTKFESLLLSDNASELDLFNFVDRIPSPGTEIPYRFNKVEAKTDMDLKNRNSLTSINGSMGIEKGRHASDFEIGKFREEGLQDSSHRNRQKTVGSENTILTSLQKLLKELETNQATFDYLTKEPKTNEIFGQQPKSQQMLVTTQVAPPFPQPIRQSLEQRPQIMTIQAPTISYFRTYN